MYFRPGELFLLLFNHPFKWRLLPNDMQKHDKVILHTYSRPSHQTVAMLKVLWQREKLSANADN